MSVQAQIRKLARSNYWQEIYSASKDASGIHLFQNINNFSGLQYLFLYWLRVYEMMYNELSNKEWPNLDEEVINNDRRCDWFLVWRSDQIKKKIRQHKDEISKNNRKKGPPIYKGKRGNK